MKTKTKSILITTCVMVFMILNACVHELPFPKGVGPGTGAGGGTNPPPVTVACSPDTIYFQNTVLPLLNSSCAMSGCHDATTRKEGVNLSTYASIMSTGGVKAGNPNSSKLYKVILDNSMPPKPSAPFTQAQKDIISKWIAQGAKNNVCNGCDTATFTFNAAISPMMDTYCKGCHNPASLGGGIDLSTYNGIKAQAASGKLFGSISHAAGFSAMPKGGSILSDCQIKQVQKWIDAGSLNN